MLSLHLFAASRSVRPLLDSSKHACPVGHSLCPFEHVVSTTSADFMRILSCARISHLSCFQLCAARLLTVHTILVADRDIFDFLRFRSKHSQASNNLIIDFRHPQMSRANSNILILTDEEVDVLSGFDRCKCGRIWPNTFPPN